MPFNSFAFILFFILFLFPYFLIPSKFQKPLLFFGNLIFYAWGGLWLLVITLSVTLVSFLFAKMIERTERSLMRKVWFVSGLTLILLPLFIYKYLDFSLGALSGLLKLFHMGISTDSFSLIAPLGLSFISFSFISYLVDVYRKAQTAEKSIANFFIYGLFFPKVASGPIERARAFLPQIDQDHSFSVERLVLGLRRILWGFFKKIVIADRLGQLVSTVFSDVGRYSGVSNIVAMYFLAMQLYIDFSAYTDIALGLAKILGYDLMENFRQPYLAISITDFWNRWHISLYTWLRDYIFYPLRRSILQSKGKWKTLTAMIVSPVLTLLASGLWHGANWTFLLWGLLFGLLLTLDVATRGLQRKLDHWLHIDAHPRIGRIIKAAFVFHVVSVLWILFRAETISDALLFIRRIFIKTTTLVELPWFRGYYFWLCLLLILIVFLVDILRERSGPTVSFSKLPSAIRFACYFLEISAITTLGIFIGQSMTFTYFRF
jgi:alginate O-acetyltransferase complex protein AlgI